MVKKMSKTLRDKLKERLVLYADRPVFLFREKGSAEVRKVTAKEFYHDVAVLGGELTVHGYEKKNIAIYGENSYYWVLAYFAITASGNTAVLPDCHLPEDELSELITFTDCECVFHSATYEDIASEMAEKTDIPFFETETFFKEISRGSAQANINAFESVTVSEHDTAEIAFTSGTSGKYKGVMLANSNVVSDTESVARALGALGMCLQILPLYHTFGLLNLLDLFFSGGCCFIEDSLRYFAKDTAEYRFDIISAVPAALPVIYEVYKNNGNGNGVRIPCGGAPEDKAMLAKLAEIGIDAYTGYGMTECSPCIAIGNDHDGIDDTSMRIIDVNKVKIDSPDENGEGEILVSGDNVMIGYYKMPEESEKVLQNGILRTGDLGRIDGNGRLYVTGRKKNLIALPNGEKVSPEAVEKKVRQIDGVSECMLTLQNNILVLSVWAPDGNRDSIQNEITKLNRIFHSSKRIAKTEFSETSFEINSIGKIIRKEKG